MKSWKSLLPLVGLAISVWTVWAIVPVAEGAAVSEKHGIAWEEGRFDGTLEEVERFIALYGEIQLTAEQEKVRTDALGPLPAACCSNFSAATCCCECNLSRSLWGLSKYLITERGAGIETVRKAGEAWLAALNPEGFPGNSCTTGRCGKSFKEGGCGGMQAHHIVF